MTDNTRTCGTCKLFRRRGETDSGQCGIVLPMCIDDLWDGVLAVKAWWLASECRCWHPNDEPDQA